MGKTIEEGRQDALLPITPQPSGNSGELGPLRVRLNVQCSSLRCNGLRGVSPQNMSRPLSSQFPRKLQHN